MPKKNTIKVLYIEDDPGARILLKKILSRPPFHYLEAVNGMEGMEIALKERPRLIIMDIDLPDIRGDELTTQLKSKKELKDVIVVALTALQEENAREKTLIAGCHGFITKPIDVQKFPQQLLQFLEGKREFIEPEKREIYHQEYEVALVKRLSQKVQELELFNKKLESTSQRLKDYSQSLENVLAILSALQAHTNPDLFIKNMIDEICHRFQFDRGAFIATGVETLMMEIKYARGIDPKTWGNYRSPLETPFISKLFENKNVWFLRHLDQIEDAKLRDFLKNFQSNQFVFAYFGIPINKYKSADNRDRILPLLESFLPTLADQENLDVDIIINNLNEYLSNEYLYQSGFIFLDNYHSRRDLFLGEEYGFLESLIKTASYMYQNLVLMEQLRFLFVKAEKEAITDPLTDLYNYRYFLLQLNREVSRAQRHKSVFSLIMIDIDFFKIYNDTYGHQAGDLILRRIAQAMLENTRNSDMVCRYGGEEFCIICPELTKEDARKTAEKLRQIVESLELPKIKSPQGEKLTISSGVASFPEDGSNAYQLIMMADKALYRAKESGRNRVC